MSFAAAFQHPPFSPSLPSLPPPLLPPSLPPTSRSPRPHSPRAPGPYESQVAVAGASGGTQPLYVMDTVVAWSVLVTRTSWVRTVVERMVMTWSWSSLAERKEEPGASPSAGQSQEGITTSATSYVELSEPSCAGSAVTLEEKEGSA